MQSQQKRVKWSRGETAEALEERTDTGITIASVELMENCIPDIYGNVSRRPALKPIPFGEHYFDAVPFAYGFKYARLTEIVPFYISENDYILIGIHDINTAEFIRIRNGECVYRKSLGSAQYPQALGSLGKVKSYAQQNNYLLIAGGTKVVKVTITLAGNDYEFTPNVEFWEYSAGWYAPNGTKTKTVNGATPGISMFSIVGQSASPWSATEVTGIEDDYTAFSVGIGLYGETGVEAIKAIIPVGSIVHMPNIGCYLRVEGYFYNYNPFPNITFDGVLNVGGTIPATGNYCRTTNTGYIECWENNALTGNVKMPFKHTNIAIVVKNTASTSGYSYVLYGEGSGFSAWHVNGSSTYSVSVWMYGSLLTPMADNTATDNSVNVEYEYINLTPSSFAPGGGQTNSIYPHPEQLCFNDQRLWAASWKISSTEEPYSVTIGSQIARYNDFKNNYNQENEPITVDILTKYKEKIIHLVDYNGLKIFTDSFEYAYQDGGVVKQSANGALESCDPIVFESLCLYVDKTGNQVRAMQYELQSNIFNSSCVNQMAPHDLVWFPVGMASYEDKYNSTGKYLFVANTLHETTPTLAVCNFVPSNQAMIWNRWTLPAYSDAKRLFNVLEMKDNALFLMVCSVNNSGANSYVVIPCVLDFNGTADLLCDVDSSGNLAISSYSTYRLTIPNTQVDIYSNGVYKLTATTNNSGHIDPTLITGFTNVTAGIRINSTIRSHPIDVGGKTKSVMKRIGKTQISVHDTEDGAITINNKTGYMNPRKDHICFYGVTGMKDEIRYTITNNKGAMFHLESLLMNIEYGTLDS